jgi:hypothetical protein
MRRVLVFLLLGPLAVTVAVTMAILPPGRVDVGLAGLIAAAFFMLTLPVSAVVGVIDSYLALRLPIVQRAGLTAAAGAIIPCVLISISCNDAVTPSFLLPFAICGAASMWLCALLSDGLGLRQPSQGYAAALQPGRRVTAPAACAAR